MFQPLPHQIQGLEWIEKTMSNKSNRGFLLADELGVGKTIQIAMYLKANRIPLTSAGVEGRPDLIVCPGAVVDTWVREIKRIKDYPEPGSKPKICVFHGSGRKSLLDESNWDYVITTYGVLTTSVDSLSDKLWARIVLDESHSIKNGSGVKRAKAAFELAPRAIHRICISGTPFNNRMSDVAAQARFIGTAPYDDPNWWKNHGNNPVSLKIWTEQCMLRRTKKELGLGLIPPIYHNITVKPTVKEAEIVEILRAKAADKFRKWSHATGIEKIELQAVILGLIQKLRIVSNTFYGKEDAYTADDVFRDCAKIARIVEDIDNRIWEDSRKGVVVFSEFSNMTFDVLECVLREYLIGVQILRFTGKESMAEKNEVVDYFNTSKHPRILLASLTAGSTGISLHHGSSSVFIIEPYYHPFMEKQAEERVHRIGQKEQVHIYKYTMDQSIELWMTGIKSRKEGLASSLSLSEMKEGSGCSFKDIAELFKDFVSFTTKDVLKKPISSSSPTSYSDELKTSNDIEDKLEKLQIKNKTNKPNQTLKPNKPIKPAKMPSMYKKPKNFLQ